MHVVPILLQTMDEPRRDRRGRIMDLAKKASAMKDKVSVWDVCVFVCACEYVCVPVCVLLK